MADDDFYRASAPARRSCRRSRFEITAGWSAVNGVLRMRRRELILLLGGAVAVPRTLRAQQKTMPVVCSGKKIMREI
jgi:UDP-N-acetylglucosamine:LPS N-acetylglucosamine transferase